jgi:Raf kinase inhibitor-like YbhB/YbcL family protein
MKKNRVLKFFFILLAALVTLVLIVLQRNLGKQNEEKAYHASLNKSITLQSSAFTSKGTMPIDFTAKGSNLSPPLNWSNIPEGTKSLALLVTDFDAPAPYLHLFTASHWVLYNISVKDSSIEKGISTAQLDTLGITVGKNYAGNHVYTGPMPPLGIHNYYFRIYALDFDHLFIKNDTRDELLNAMKGHVLGYGELVGRF